jgi:hypothetical protein
MDVACVRLTAASLRAIETNGEELEILLQCYAIIRGLITLRTPMLDDFLEMCCSSSLDELLLELERASKGFAGERSLRPNQFCAWQVHLNMW